MEISQRISQSLRLSRTVSVRGEPSNVSAFFLRGNASAFAMGRLSPCFQLISTECSLAGSLSFYNAYLAFSKKNYILKQSYCIYFSWNSVSYVKLKCGNWKV
jgi:hypothetical protein